MSLLQLLNKFLSFLPICRCSGKSFAKIVDLFQVNDYSKYDDFGDSDSHTLSSLNKQTHEAHSMFDSVLETDTAARNGSSNDNSNMPSHLADDTYSSDLQCVVDRDSVGSESGPTSPTHSLSESSTIGDVTDLDSASSCNKNYRNLEKQSSRNSMDELLFDLYDRHGGKYVVLHKLVNSSVCRSVL